MKQHRASRTSITMSRRMSAIALMVEDVQKKYVSEERPRFMFHPYSLTRKYWDYLLIALVAYTAAVIPWNVAFQMNDDCDAPAEGEESTTLGCMPESLKIIDIFVDTLFWIDIVVNFRTAFVDKKKHTVFDSKQVAKNYLKGWFTLDLIGTFPFEKVAKAMLAGQELSSKQLMYLRLLKLPRIIRVARLLKKLDIFTTNKIIRVLKLIFLFLLLGHWIGCLWYFVGSYQAENIGANIFTGDFVWIQYPLNAGMGYEATDLRTKYTAAFYWAITTMTSVGYGDIVPLTNIERYFTIFVQLLGAICTAVIFGNVGAALISFESAMAKNNERVQTINEIIGFHDLPTDLLGRIRENINYLLFKHRGLDASHVLADLPGNLRTDVLMFSLGEKVKQTGLFQNCKDEGFIRTIVANLNPKAYCPDDVIYYEGESTKEIYFIETGKVKVLHGREMFLIAILKEGDTFGESELFSLKKRPVTIQAVTYCDVYALESEVLMKILKNFPECEPHVMKCVQRRRKAYQKVKDKRGSKRLSVEDYIDQAKKAGKLQDEIIKYEQQTTAESIRASEMQEDLRKVRVRLDDLRTQMQEVLKGQTFLLTAIEEYEKLKSHEIDTEGTSASHPNTPSLRGQNTPNLAAPNANSDSFTNLLKN